MEIKEVFNGVYRINGKLATENLVKGTKVYDEDLISSDSREYRTWNPYRSKLAAAILKSLKNMTIRDGSNVLYLGAATGTTCSHISDIIRENGNLYCVEFSERNMRQLLDVCSKRENMFPEVLANT